MYSKIKGKFIIGSLFLSTILFGAIIDNVSINEKDLNTAKVISVKIYNGWNMFSLPGYSSINVKDLFFSNPNINHTVFTYDLGMYNKYDNNNSDYILKPGKGVWLYSDKNYNLNFNISTTLNNSIIVNEVTENLSKDKNISIDIIKGWNLVGFPGYTKYKIQDALSSINFYGGFQYNPALQTYNIYRSNGTIYKNWQEIIPGQAFWLYSYKNKNVNFNYSKIDSNNVNNNTNTNNNNVNTNVNTNTNTNTNIIKNMANLLKSSDINYTGVAIYSGFYDYTELNCLKTIRSDFYININKMNNNIKGILYKDQLHPDFPINLNGIFDSNASDINFSGNYKSGIIDVSLSMKVDLLKSNLDNLQGTYDNTYYKNNIINVNNFVSCKGTFNLSKK